MSRQRSALFGVIGIKLGYFGEDAIPPITPDSLDALPEDLDKQLLDSGVITREQHNSIASLVDEALTKVQGNVDKFLESLAGDTALSDVLPTIHTADTIETESDKTIQLEDPRTIQTDGDATIRTDGAKTVVSDAGYDPNATRVDPRAGTATLGDIPGVHEHPNRYEYIKDVARGGMGSITMVHDQHLGRDVALKQLLPDRVKGATRGGSFSAASLLTVPIIARFLQEARINSQLEHPNIVPVYEMGFRNDGSLYYTMQLLRGQSLQDHLKDAKTLEDRLRFLPNFMSLCQAIAYAHSRGVIHRDLKPLNVMMGEFGETLLIDWGIAKLKGKQDMHAKEMKEHARELRLSDAEATAKTVYGQTIGSPYYMAPEQAEGKTDEVDERSDTYALGAILYHILAGQPPYKGMNVYEFLEKVVNFDPKPIKEIEPEAPPELIAIVDRAMQRKAADRYQYAKDIADEVERFITGGLVGAYKYSTTELLKRWVKKHSKIIATIAAALVALIAVGIFSYIRIYQERSVALRELYKSNVALANVSIEQRLITEAENLLANSPEKHRQWEWGYLQYLSNAEAQTLDAGGRYTFFTGNGAQLVTGSPNGTVGVYDAKTMERMHTLAERTGFQYVMDAAVSAPRVVISGDEAITVYDTSSGASVFEFAEPKEGSFYHAVSLSDDGGRLAALCSDRVLRIWNLGDNSSLMEEPVRPNSFVLQFSPDGSRLLVGNMQTNEETLEQAYVVSLFEPSSKSILASGTLPYPETLKTASFSPDGALLALATDTSLELWTTSPFTRVNEVEARFAYPDTIAFSPNGALLGGGTRDGGIGVWRTPSLEGVLLPDAHAEQVRVVTITPDSRTFITGSYDRTLKLWDPLSLAPLRTIRGHERDILSLAVSADATRLVSGSLDNRTKVWDLLDEVNSVPVGAVAFDAATARVAGISGDTIAVWDAKTGHRIASIDAPDARGEGSTDAAANRIVAIAQGAPVVATVAGLARAPQLLLWNYESGEAPEVFPIPREAAPKEVYLAPSGAMAATLTGSNIDFFLPSEGPGASIENATAFGFLPDNTHIVFAQKHGEEGKDRLVVVRAIGSDQTVAQHVLPNATETRFAFTPDSSRVYIATAEREGNNAAGGVYVLPIGGGEATQLAKADEAYSSIAVTDDGAYLAVGSRVIELRDSGTGEVKHTITTHAGEVHGLAFSPDGARLVSASIDGTFKLWDARTSEPILTLATIPRSTGDAQVNQPLEATFSDDGHILYTRTFPVVQPPFISRALDWKAQ